MKIEKKLITVIPSYNPDKGLVKTIKELSDHECILKIVVVDDGSESKEVFEQIDLIPKIKILRHSINRGKGRALKTAFKYLDNLTEEFVLVTADADGQHLLKDIVAVYKAVEHEKSFVLGVREFAGEVPLRSLFGNSITKLVFLITTGKSLIDTQTGLRGFSKDLIKKLLIIEGNKYEYETNMLIKFLHSGINPVQIKIDTVYIQNNKSSHFRPIFDSMLIYLVFLRYSSISFISFVIDVTLFAILSSAGVNVYMSTYLSRFCSSSINFYANKNITFKSNEQLLKLIFKYILSAFTVATMSSWFVIKINYITDIDLVKSKIIADMFLFLLTFYISKKWIFKN